MPLTAGCLILTACHKAPADKSASTIAPNATPAAEPAVVAGDEEVTPPQAAPHPQPAATTNQPAEPPLLLDDEPPLLLDEGAPLLLGEAPPDTGEGADNSRCHVCHINLSVEELAVTHARAKVGCADCHGASDAHIADESWASGGNGTPPDILYRRAEIAAGCYKCHPKSKLDDEVHKEADAPEEVCTDCHGQHRLPQRKCHWK